MGSVGVKFFKIPKTFSLWELNLCYSSGRCQGWVFTPGKNHKHIFLIASNYNTRREKLSRNETLKQINKEYAKQRLLGTFNAR